MNKIAAYLPQSIELVVLLDTLGYDIKSHDVTDRDDSGNIFLRGLARIHVVDEGLVYFQQISGESVQIAQRRVACTEIVDRYLDAHVFKLMNAQERPVNRLYHDGLSYLYFEIFRWNTAVSEDIAHLLDEIILHEVTHRDIDTEHNIELCPFHEVSEEYRSLSENSAVHLVNKSDLFRNGNEFPGAYEASVSVLHTSESLKASKLMRYGKLRL